VLQHPGSNGVERAQERAARERARAVRAAEIAERHELLAVQGSPNLRQLHLDMAAMHRDIERIHHAADGLHSSHAARLTAGTVPPFIAAVADEIGADHVGISLVRRDRTEAVTVASDTVTTAVHEVERTLGEGPVHDVAERGIPVVADEVSFLRWWPLFAPEVVRLGVHSVAAEPLRTTAGCLGVLTVFDPSAEQAASLPMVADALVHTALLVPESADPLDIPLLAGADDQKIVHQATGMVAVQLGCDVAGGLAILRARAFAADRSLAALADDVVHRGLKVS
jgi:hypothetical protein